MRLRKRGRVALWRRPKLSVPAGLSAQDPHGGEDMLFPMLQRNLKRQIDDGTICVVGASHFDVAVARVGDSADASRSSVDLIDQGLAVLGRRMVVLDCADRNSLPSRQMMGRRVLGSKQVCHEAVLLKPNAQECGREAETPGNALDRFQQMSRLRFLCAASKILCIEDRLFDVADGAEFARMSASAAHRAGRLSGLLCSDLSTVFHKREEIFATIGANLDFVAGESKVVLPLFGLMRIDTLVPELARRGIGLILHRKSNRSLFVRPGGKTVEKSDDALPDHSFWSEFVPCSLQKMVECKALPFPSRT